MSEQKALRAILTPGLGPGTTLEVNGHDITKTVRSMTLTAEAGNFVTAEIDVVVFDAEINGEATIQLPEATHDALMKLGWTPPDQP
jgi:hypothetical protein